MSHWSLTEFSNTHNERVVWVCGKCGKFSYQTQQACHCGARDWKMYRSTAHSAMNERLSLSTDSAESPRLDFDDRKQDRAHGQHNATSAARDQPVKGLYTPGTIRYTSRAARYTSTATPRPSLAETHRETNGKRHFQVSNWAVYPGHDNSGCEPRPATSVVTDPRTSRLLILLEARLHSLSLNITNLFRSKQISTYYDAPDDRGRYSTCDLPYRHQRGQYPPRSAQGIVSYQGVVPHQGYSDTVQYLPSPAQNIKHCRIGAQGYAPATGAHFVPIHDNGYQQQSSSGPSSNQTPGESDDEDGADGEERVFNRGTSNPERSYRIDSSRGQVPVAEPSKPEDPNVPASREKDDSAPAMPCIKNGCNIRFRYVSWLIQHLHRKHRLSFCAGCCMFLKKRSTHDFERHRSKTGDICDHHCISSTCRPGSTTGPTDIIPVGRRHKRIRSGNPCPTVQNVSVQDRWHYMYDLAYPGQALPDRFKETVFYNAAGSHCVRPRKRKAGDVAQLALQSQISELRNEVKRLKAQSDTVRQTQDLSTLAQVDHRTTKLEDLVQEMRRRWPAGCAFPEDLNREILGISRLKSRQVDQGNFDYNSLQASTVRGLTSAPVPQTDYSPYTRRDHDRNPTQPSRPRLDSCQPGPSRTARASQTSYHPEVPQRFSYSSPRTLTQQTYAMLPQSPTAYDTHFAVLPHNPSPSNTQYAWQDPTLEADNFNWEEFLQADPGIDFSHQGNFPVMTAGNDYFGLMSPSADRW